VWTSDEFVSFKEVGVGKTVDVNTNVAEDLVMLCK